MRQVFSSPRLENVERVAALLEQAGVEVRITHGRSYKGGLRGDFSYRDNARTGPVPAVWIVRSEDQMLGREILREAGMLDSTRTDTGYSLPAFRTEEPPALDDPARKRAFRLKIGLLLTIAAVLALALFTWHRTTPSPAGAPGATADARLPPGVAPTPDSLALAVLAGELPDRAGQAVCLEIDGHDPSPALLAALPPSPGRVMPVSRCDTMQWQVLAIGDYRPGPARGANGRITLERRRDGGRTVIHTYDARPDGDGWRVIEPY